jgi:hypothetical protein
MNYDQLDEEYLFIVTAYNYRHLSVCSEPPVLYEVLKTLLLHRQTHTHSVGVPYKSHI